MRYLVISLLLGFAINTSADNVMRFTTSSSVDAFPEVIEMFSTMYARVGYRIEITRLPERRSLYEASNRGGVDGELARVKEAEPLLSELIRIPVPVVDIAASAFVKDVTIKVNGWKSLTPYKLGSLRGILGVERKLVGLYSIEAGSPSQLLELLERGRIQIAVMPKPMGEFALKRLPYNIKVIEPPIDTFSVYHYVNKRHKALVPQLTAILSELTGVSAEL
ncbi:hypothetical protein [Alkalimarinus sediminis]|uniref:Uncharacterized protein n=1 Tax=Alkalimarinus sediminis TaxID=1632866 RepID=A0A9E8HRX4_9ALTE|nr:hypothetical protein [Alkalimarinus sediminis]UZW74669.1 hypothetical protein NNL22_16860 [Alkalimarinus sediminis]